MHDPTRALNEYASGLTHILPVNNSLYLQETKVDTDIP